jgi:hypothetical protein
MNERRSRPRRRRSSAKPQRLEIRVVHGSLEHALYPVVVGHNQGMPLEGAEGFLNKQLGGRLAERVLLGAYAEQEGSAISVSGEPGCSPPGALVLGLGPAGEVTAAKVTRAMTQAALLRAVTAAEDTNTDHEIGLSAVLVGANPMDGISVQRSVAALVDGLISAIHILSTTPRLNSTIRIGTLEIIELYAARADAALQGLKSLSTLVMPPGPGLELLPTKTLSKRAGRKAGGIPADYNKGAWLRLDIRAAGSVDGPSDGYRRLEVTSAARRARADRLEQTLEAATVDALIAVAVTRSRPDPQITNTLYELLLPNELKPDLQSADNLLLLLEPETAGYPWEALATRDQNGNPSPLALRGGMLRQFADPATRNARFDVRQAAGRHALVIGNPPAAPAPELPGAAEEARRVDEILSGSGEEAPFDVCSLIWSDEGARAVGLPEIEDNESWVHIVNALYHYEYRIIHVAAHGAFDPEQPARSGLLIGPDQFLTAQTVAQLSAVPELVFLNCCHSGRIEDPASTHAGRANVHLLAASIARALMEIGVRAVVAAGWSVDDAAAVAFATTFYEEMLANGAGFGDAVKNARSKARETKRDSMTWAAYQCYGDPEFRLRST